MRRETKRAESEGLPRQDCNTGKWIKFFEELTYHYEKHIEDNIPEEVSGARETRRPLQLTTINVNCPARGQQGCQVYWVSDKN